MTLQLYNVAINEFIKNLNQSHFILRVANQKLTSYVHNSQTRKVLILSEQDVQFVRERITLTQFDTHRSSYINDILIQSRDQSTSHLCDSCDRSRSELNSFSYCRHVVKHFDEACNNCK
jgi:hypothetical protein